MSSFHPDFPPWRTKSVTDSRAKNPLFIPYTFLFIRIFFLFIRKEPIFSPLIRAPTLTYIKAPAPPARQQCHSYIKTPFSQARSTSWAEGKLPSALTPLPAFQTSAQGPPDRRRARNGVFGLRVIWLIKARNAPDATIRPRPHRQPEAHVPGASGP